MAEAANDVVERLQILDVHHFGAITMEPLDTVLSTAAHHAEDAADGDAGDAVIWDELVSRTREESSLSVTFVMFLCIACLLAAVGVINDSAVTVVGAMVVGPGSGRWRHWRSRSCSAGCRWRAAPGAALLIGFPVGHGGHRPGHPWFRGAGLGAADQLQ